jgi:hypothetical protein
MTVGAGGRSTTATHTVIPLYKSNVAGSQLSPNTL